VFLSQFFIFFLFFYDSYRTKCWSYDCRWWFWKLHHHYTHQSCWVFSHPYCNWYNLRTYQVSSPLVHSPFWGLSVDRIWRDMVVILASKISPSVNGFFSFTNLFFYEKIPHIRPCSTSHTISVLVMGLSESTEYSIFCKFSISKYLFKVRISVSWCIALCPKISLV